MEKKLEKLDGLKRRLRIAVEADNLKQIKERVVERLKKQVKIPGFREGQAPADIVEKRHPDLVREEIIKEAIPFYYEEGLSSYGLKPVSLPTIKDVRYEGGGISFTAEFEIEPQLEIEEEVYKNIKLSVRSLEVRDEEIAQVIKSIKKRIAGVIMKPEGEITDNMVFSWSGYANEEEFREAVGAELYINKTIQRKREMEDTIVRALLEKVNVNLPQALIERQKKALVNSEINSLRQRRVSEEDIKKYEDDIQNKSLEMARKNVKLYYILEAIARKENLKFSEDNIYETVMSYLLSILLKK